jgi:hypothetical protein
MNTKSGWALSLILGISMLTSGTACRDTSPGGEALMAPAEREATPVTETGLERTEQARSEEWLEEWNVEDPAEDDDAG